MLEDNAQAEDARRAMDQLNQTLAIEARRPRQ